MQVKKEEVKKAIIEKAKLEFLEYGFEKASLRRIVKSAGTSIGNFYNYFNSKEELFEAIVGESYNMIIYYIKNHNKIERKDFLWDEDNIIVIREELLELLKKAIPRFSSAFVILLDGSNGTKFEGAKEILIDVISEHFFEHMREFNKEYKSPEISRILAEQIIRGISIIIRNYEDHEIRNKLIVEQLLFFAIGTMGILKS